MPPRFQIPFGFVVYLCPEEYLLFMKILIVEDEPSLREIMVQTLRREQYVVEQASDYASALEKIAGYDYDCILLDIMLPDGSGLRILEELRRQRKPAGVIIISARDSLDDKVEGLELGADDYLPKPFHASELLARMRALLRRPREIVEDGSLAAAGLVLDTRSFIVRAMPDGEGDDVELTPKEAALLEALMRAGGRVVAKDALAARVWGPYATGAGNRLEVLMHALREKIARTGVPASIDTVRGAGYRLHEK